MMWQAEGAFAQQKGEGDPHAEGAPLNTHSLRASTPGGLAPNKRKKARTHV